MRLRPGTRLLPQLVGKKYEVEPALSAQQYQPFDTSPVPEETDVASHNSDVPHGDNVEYVHEQPIAGVRTSQSLPLARRSNTDELQAPVRRPFNDYRSRIGDSKLSPYSAVPAAFWRGGTSNGILLQYHDLPSRFRPPSEHFSYNPSIYAEQLRPFFASVMGSPDPWGRQLNGMGGGISSLSKAVIVRRTIVPQYDFEYTFLQVGVKDGKLDLNGNCGNMTSAVVPFAISRQMLDSSRIRYSVGPRRQLRDWNGTIPLESTNTQSMSINIRNTNTAKIVRVEFEVCSRAGRWFYQSSGTTAIAGVPGFASPITMSFLNPGGSKTGQLFPTGNAVDSVNLSDGIVIKASLVDCSNPGIFIDGWSVGMEGPVSSDQLSANTTLMGRLEEIRQAGARLMGLDPQVPSIPKIVLVFPAYDSDADIVCMALSMGQAHKAVPLTLALNLGVACRLPGTIPYDLARRSAVGMTTIAHPAGSIEVGAEIENGKVLSAKLLRTARCLMDGYVNAASDADVEEVPVGESLTRMVNSVNHHGKPFPSTRQRRIYKGYHAKSIAPSRSIGR